MRLAIQPAHLPGNDLTEKFLAARRFGYDAIELQLGPGFDLFDRLADVRAAMARSGLPVCGLCTHPMHDPFLPDATERAKRFAALTDLLTLCDELSIGGIVSVPVRPPVRHESQDHAELKQFAIAIYGEWAASLPAGRSQLWLEPLNRYEANFLNRVGQAVAIASKVNHSRVAALADLFHMNIEESSFVEPLLKAGPLLGHVHIADNNRYEPGAGMLPFAPAFAVLKQIDYHGYVSIECSLLSAEPEIALPESARYLRDVWRRAERA
jgi:sugar phosphate isomerase/epimerase